MPAATDVDAYLAALPDAQRVVLESMRRTIRAAAPGASESIAYGMPAYRQEGRFLVSFAAFKAHCSLFPVSEGVREALGAALEPYLAGKGTIRFRVDDPLPVPMVRRIVQVRLVEVLGRPPR